jgi:hypothetical protein
MINKTTLRSLRNAEFIQFISDVLTILAKNEPQVLLVLAQFNALQAELATMEALFKKEEGSPLTDELIDLDSVRDNHIVGMATMVLAYSYHFDAALKTHGQTLQAHLAPYGSASEIARENYQSETAIINNLISDWNTKPELAAAIAALNLTDWKNLLQTANTSFNEKYLARTQQQGNAPTETVWCRRPLAMEAYDKLIKKLNAQSNVNDGVDPWGKAVNEVSALEENYTTLVANRKSVSASKAAAKANT